jgi:hypothetical protein
MLQRQTKLQRQEEGMIQLQIDWYQHSRHPRHTPSDQRLKERLRQTSNGCCRQERLAALKAAAAVL